METIATLTGYDTKSGSNAKGGWTLHLFDDGNGFKCQTFDGELGKRLLSLLNQPARIIYEQQTRDNFVNNIVSAVESAGAALPVVQAPSTPVQDVAPRGDDPKQAKIHRQTAAKVAGTLWSDLPAEERTYSNFLGICTRLVSYFDTGSTS